MIKEFKPALIFLGKFLGIYVVGNIIYGLYITKYYPLSDPITNWIARQVGLIISLVTTDVQAVANTRAATISLLDVATNETIISVFEGCNGVNVAIVFMAFLVAYKGTVKRTLIFSAIGLIAIHIFNMARIILLFQQAKNNSPYFYYTHKYFFTAILYMVVVILWWFWVTKFNGMKNDNLRQKPVG